MDSRSPARPVTDLAGKRLLIGTAIFPNALQPWFLNSTVQAIEHGADVYLVAAARTDTAYQREVDERGLIARTAYIDMYGLGGVTTLLRNLVSTHAVFRRSAWTGLLRTLRHVPLTDPRAFVHALSLVVPMGLPDVALIHCHALSLASRLLPLCRARGVPLVITFHGLTPEGVQGLGQPEQAEVYACASTVFVNTEWAREQVIALGCPREKTCVIPQGIRLDDFPFAPQALTVGEPVRLLSVGRLHQHKGYSDVLRGLSELHAKGVRFDYRVVGSGPHREQFERECVDLGIAEHVQFVGEKVDLALREEYARAHVFVLASVAEKDGWTETQGVVLQEAQATGKLVVATRSGGIPECLGEDCGAMLVDEHDGHGIALAIEHLLAHADAWPTWSASARRWVSERYAIEVIGNQLVQRYLLAIESESSHPAQARS